MYGDVGVVVLVALGMAMLYISYISTGLTPLYQVGLAVASMIGVGIAITWIKSLTGAYGAYMIGGKRGIGLIEGLSRSHHGFWEAMAMWGLVLGFGLITYPLLRGRVDRKIYLFGIASIMVTVAVLTPNFTLALQLIQLPQLQTAVNASLSAQGSQAALNARLIETGIGAVVGFSGYIIVALLTNAAFILLGVAHYILSILQGAPQISSVTGQIPSVAPLLPGIDIPLVPGILALAFILVVHEFSHGVLSKMYGVKIKSIGMLLFGVLPMGAYVEPDEKKVNRLDSLKQSKIFSAGIAANFIFALVFFIPFLLAATYLMPAVMVPGGVYITNTIKGYPAAMSGVQDGSKIISWNGYNVSNITAFETFAMASEKPNSIVQLDTDRGNYTLNEMQNASNHSIWRIGIVVAYVPSTPGKGLIDQIGFNVYATIAFLFLLNFLVAVVNYLPIPGFDGWRIYKANVKNGKLVTCLSLLVVAGFVLGAVPLLANYL